MRGLIVGIMITSLVGCSTNMGHRDPVEVKGGALNEAANEANSRPLVDLPSAVSADLMPALDSSDYVSNTAMEKRFRVNARNVDARAFFGSLVKGTPFQYGASP